MLTFQWEEYLAQVITLVPLPVDVVDCLRANGLLVSSYENFTSHSRNFIISKQGEYYLVNGLRCKKDSISKLILDNLNFRKFQLERERMSDYILSLFKN